MKEQDYTIDDLEKDLENAGKLDVVSGVLRIAWLVSAGFCIAAWWGGSGAGNWPLLWAIFFAADLIVEAQGYR